MTALDDYAPFDAGIGANRTEDWFRKHFRHLTGSGVVSGVGNEFAVTQHSTGADQTVDVDTGECYLRGHWGESTSKKNIGLSSAHATLARIDRIVLRVDFGANTISVEVLEGTPNASPTIPALTQDTTKWEIGLARIARAANDNTIGTADITDERNLLTFAGIEGLPVKRAVRAASATNVTLASACEAGDTFGGVTLAYGDRIGLFGQTTASENGIYTVNQTGAPTRATDADTSAKMRPNTLVAVSEGTLADKWYQLTTNAPIVLGTTNLTWSEFGATAAACGARAYLTGTQALANTTATAVGFPSETFDTDGFHDTVTNNSRMTVPAGKGGTYVVVGAAWFAANATGDRRALLYVNGSAVTWSDVINAGGVYAPIALVSDVLVLAAGDYVQLFAYQSSGGSLNLDGNGLSTGMYLSLIRIGS